MMADRDEAGRFLPGHDLAGPGRPSEYDPSMNEAARKLALLGLTDSEIAAFFGITETTINNWKNEFPAFLASLNAGKTIADAEVADSLYRRAMGEVVFTERRVKGENGEYEVIRLMQSVPSDPGAAKLWLTNRQPRLWRDKVTHEGAGENGEHLHKVAPDDAFATFIATLGGHAAAPAGSGDGAGAVAGEGAAQPDHT